MILIIFTANLDKPNPMTGDLAPLGEGLLGRCVEQPPTTCEKGGCWEANIGAFWDHEIANEMMNLLENQPLNQYRIELQLCGL